MSQASTSVPHNIFTIGHSTRSARELLDLLKEFDIQLLVDVRRFPGSAKWPQFNQANLEQILPDSGIQYLHMEGLGGRRPIQKQSKNTAWRNTSFRAYADYMETPEFRSAIAVLEALAEKQTTAIMCAEALWWRCHRAMIADFLKAAGWQVYHIMGHAKTTVHPYTAVAKLDHQNLTYR